MTVRVQGAATGKEAPKSVWWNDANVRAVIYQVITVLVILGIGWYLISNTLANLASRNIATGLNFLGRESSMPIGQHLIDYTPASSYGRAYLVGMLNTIFVSAIGIVLATILGTIIGVARLSSNWLVARMATVYVEMLRNIPLLLQLFVWYGILLALPPIRQASNPLPGVFLSQRGLFVPVLEPEPVHGIMGILLAVGIIATWIYARWGKRRQEATGKPVKLLWPALGFIIGLPLLAWAFAGFPFRPSVPELKGFNMAGGSSLTPEFVALLLGLVTYTAAFIAETVRAGILAVPKGQPEAARALGLSEGRLLRLIVLPQALRVIIPPTTSQYLNLTKNSSLAVGIAYPDLVSIGNTIINQTGQAVEGIAMIMAVYLSLSLLIAALMNFYNKSIALKER